jgi:hypothetical protein
LIGDEKSVLSAAPNDNEPNGRRVIRVATSTYFVIGFVSAMLLILGTGLLAEKNATLGVLCLAGAPVTFSFFCFQRLVFKDGVMSFCRPFFPTQCVELRTVSQVIIALKSEGGKMYWSFRLLDRGHLLCKLNPKLYSFEGLDSVFSEIRRYSPNVVIEDGTRGFRSRSANVPSKLPHPAPEVRRG